MYKSIRNLMLIVLAGSMFAFSANAQTETKVVANSDGSYSVIEYPVDKDVEIRLAPMKGINGTGMAHIMRTANGTKVVFDLTECRAIGKSCTLMLSIQPELRPIWAPSLSTVDRARQNL